VLFNAILFDVSIILLIYYMYFLLSNYF